MWWRCDVPASGRTSVPNTYHYPDTRTISNFSLTHGHLMRWTSVLLKAAWISLLCCYTSANPRPSQTHHPANLTSQYLPLRSCFKRKKRRPWRKWRWYSSLPVCVCVCVRACAPPPKVHFNRIWVSCIFYHTPEAVQALGECRSTEFVEWYMKMLSTQHSFHKKTDTSGPE